MSEECTHDCSNCSAACSSRDAAPQHDAPNPNSSVKKVIGVVSGKGGVGKSMTSALLACAMARRGYHCGILDADITGPSIPKLFGIHGRAMADEKGCWPIQSRMGIDVMSINLLVENEEDPVVWRGPVIAGAVKQFWTDVVWKDVDFLFVDMPPGTGDVPLTVFQSLPVDGIVVVASPQELVSMIVAKAVNMAEMMKVPMLGIVENMSYIVCPDCGKHINVFGNSHVDEVAAKHHLPVLAKCPIDPKLAELSDAGMIETYVGEYLEGAADACEKLRFEAIADPALLEGGGDLAIDLAIDADARTLTIRDNGIGMSREELMHNLGTVAHSGTKRFLDSLAAGQQVDAHRKRADHGRRSGVSRHHSGRRLEGHARLQSGPQRR